MKFALVVLHPPDQLESQRRTLGFGRALITNGHELTRVFFYGDGTRIGEPGASEARDLWLGLSDTSATELAICSASAERNGIIKAPDSFVVAGVGGVWDAGFVCEG
ncbi:MAG: DsrE family protein, partial [Halieaceae bacterium]